MAVRNVEDAGEAPDDSRAECRYRIPEITKDVDTFIPAADDQRREILPAAQDLIRPRGFLTRGELNRKPWAPPRPVLAGGRKRGEPLFQTN